MAMGEGTNAIDWTQQTQQYSNMLNQWRTMQQQMQAQLPHLYSNDTEKLDELLDRIKNIEQALMTLSELMSLVLQLRSDQLTQNGTSTTTTANS